MKRLIKKTARQCSPRLRDLAKIQAKWFRFCQWEIKSNLTTFLLAFTILVADNCVFIIHYESDFLSFLASLAVIHLLSCKRPHQLLRFLKMEPTPLLSLIKNKNFQEMLSCSNGSWWKIAISKHLHAKNRIII